MIIVNQDEKLTANFDKVEYIWISNPVEDDDDTFKIVAESQSSNMLIGKYKTEERAKEVLQEIITRYGNWENIKVGQPQGICEPVYYMPED